MKALELKIPPPVYALGMAGLMWLLNQYFPVAQIIPDPWNNIGLGIIVLAIALDSSSLFLFLKKHTTINPMHPDHTKSLVTEGLYRYTRNPMYVGLLVILTGFAIMLGSITPFFILPLFYWLITTQQILPEERILEEKFGQQYLDYKKRVKRWL